MMENKKEDILISKTNLEFENEGVLNPAAIREGDNVLLFFTGRCGINSKLPLARLAMGKYTDLGI